MLAKFLVDVITVREGPMLLLELYPELIPYVPYFVKKHWMKIETLIINRELLQDYLMVSECNVKS